jgi:hypothetical protein
MDISILLNGDKDNNINVMPMSSISNQFYALRDIKMGEELLTDYDVYETVWADVGL